MDLVLRERVFCFAHVALLTPEALVRAGLSPAAKVLDLKGRLRCRGMFWRVSPRRNARLFSRAVVFGSVARLQNSSG